MISYAKLVDLALESHDPRWHAHKVQYASLVLARDDEQLMIAKERTARTAARLGAPLSTRVEPLKRFWLAEDYHQKYSLRGDRVLAADFRAMYGDDEAALRESTAAARVNGYLAGDGARAQLATEIDFLGLSEAGRSRLISKVGNMASSGSCSVL